MLESHLANHRIFSNKFLEHPDHAGHVAFCDDRPPTLLVFREGEPEFPKITLHFKSGERQRIQRIFAGITGQILKARPNVRRIQNDMRQDPEVFDRGRPTKTNSEPRIIEFVGTGMEKGCQAVHGDPLIRRFDFIGNHFRFRENSRGCHPLRSQKVGESSRTTNANVPCGPHRPVTTSFRSAQRAMLAAAN